MCSTVELQFTKFINGLAKLAELAETEFSRLPPGKWLAKLLLLDTTVVVIEFQTRKGTLLRILQCSQVKFLHGILSVEKKNRFAHWYNFK